jgi:hypothetical protein
MLTFEANGTLGVAAIVEKLQVGIPVCHNEARANTSRTSPSSRYSTAPTPSTASQSTKTVFSSW